ncbi:lytic murein transglycosylase [Citreimonas salinaria]|uniref:Lytic murein transglycosylase n=1 Tax=Citreimonas salinaria TaxID=321339 RepID=A0A1H3I4B0_9RHOB|nr:lytic murein transglycosylase [Citreimonas salinaria]SDY22452.1 lytic murein transglycosylase [Citreimonas salinaria]
MDRRGFTLGAAGLVALSACGAAPRAPLPAADAATFRPQPNPAYDAWVAAFRGRAAAQGISAATLEAAFSNAGFVPEVIERDRNQAEFKRSLEDYLALVAPEDKIAFGRTVVARLSGTLSAIADRYGVPAQIIGAVWGVESYFGTRRGEIPVVSATSTLAFDGRRGRFFEANLIEALRILQRGDTTPAQLRGSWAGAMGHTQFIPTTYALHAVDFDGDGRRDVWSDDPTDALASTANFLRENGWRPGLPWGVEVRLPGGFDTRGTGRGNRRPTSAWRSLGVVPARGGALPELGDAALLTPSGTTGPAFLVSRNFDTILRYNPSENYGLGVGILSDRLTGAGPLVGDFGPDATGLRQSERKALQAGLNRAGFDAGSPDGVIGDKTRAAIAAFQRARGLPVTGVPSRELLAQL